MLRHYGARCLCCKRNDVVIHVDHIKPRSKYPKLQLEFTNCQPLCGSCNRGKSNIYKDDWRPPAPVPKLNPSKLMAFLNKFTT
ncbi:HNH endonuclease [Dyadobacter bucti]|uniref:HNH endonuclease n=1 Tax=Dyadobacter bucti TaxID=2572203 RepID=UPI0035B58717